MKTKISLILLTFSLIFLSSCTKSDSIFLDTESSTYYFAVNSSKSTLLIKGKSSSAINVKTDNSLLDVQNISYSCKTKDFTITIINKQQLFYGKSIPLTISNEDYFFNTIRILIIFPYE